MGREGWWDLEGLQERGTAWDGALGTVSPPQTVDIHKEKVSRREIGSLTISKRFPTYQKIVAPPNPPVLEPYYRKPLNFSVLDDIGHGIKVSHSRKPPREGFWRPCSPMEPFPL